LDHQQVLAVPLVLLNLVVRVVRVIQEVHYSQEDRLVRLGLQNLADQLVLHYRADLQLPEVLAVLLLLIPCLAVSVDNDYNNYSFILYYFILFF
jgi:hypothetical protein